MSKGQGLSREEAERRVRVLADVRARTVNLKAMKQVLLVKGVGLESIIQELEKPNLDSVDYDKCHSLVDRMQAATQKELAQFEVVRDQLNRLQKIAEGR